MKLIVIIEYILKEQLDMRTIGDAEEKKKN